jgi:hypothetical protein
MYKDRPVLYPSSILYPHKPSIFLYRGSLLYVVLVYAYPDLFKYQVWQKSGPTREAKARSNWSPMMMRKVMQVPAKSKLQILKYSNTSNIQIQLSIHP